MEKHENEENIDDLFEIDDIELDDFEETLEETKKSYSIDDLFGDASVDEAEDLDITEDDNIGILEDDEFESSDEEKDLFYQEDFSSIPKMVDEISEKEDQLSVENEVEKFDNEENSNKIKILIITLLLLLVLVVLFLVLRKNGKKEEKPSSTNPTTNIKEDLDEVMIKYGEASLEYFMNYYNDNKSYPDTIPNTLIEKYTVDCEIEKMYDDGTIYLDKCSINDSDKIYSYGELKEENPNIKPEDSKVTGVSLDTNSLSMKPGATATLKVTISPSTATNKKVIWESSNESVVTVDAFGRVKAIKEGKATITVKTEEGDYKATVDVTVDKDVIVATGVKLNTTTMTLKVGSTATLKATVSPTNATNQDVKWKSSNEDIITVNNGVLTAKKAGQATITVTTSDGGYKATATIKVEAIEVTSIKLNKTSIDLKAGGKENLIATINPTDATDKTVKWESSNVKVAKVSNKGEVEGVGIGTTTITVTTSNGKKASATVTVSPTPVTSVEISSGNITLNEKETKLLTATVKPTTATNKSVEWKSSNESVATVDASGKVTAISKGEATITVTTKDGNRTSSIKVTVVKPVTGVSLSWENGWASSTLRVGRSQKLVATVTPNDASDKSVEWKSSDESVATVDANGNVTAKAEGEATITVTTKDGSYTAKMDITVRKGWF